MLAPGGKSMKNADTQSCYKKYEDELLETNDKDEFAAKMYKVMVNKKENLVLTASMVAKENTERRASFRSQAKGSIKQSLFKGNVTDKKDLKSKMLTDPSGDDLGKDYVNLNEVEGLEHDEEKYEKKLVLAPYILAVAMGIHAMFAGLSLGIVTDFGGFLGMLLAILTHKWAESMTIGISFAKHLRDVGMKQTMILLFMFSFFTPLGIA